MSTFHAYVDAAHFHEALGNVLRFAAKRSRLPILEEAQVRFEDGHCVLTCTNLDQWCMSTIPAVGDSFSFVFVGTRKILSACKYFSGELELTYTIEPTETNPDPRGQRILQLHQERPGRTDLFDQISALPLQQAVQFKCLRLFLAGQKPGNLSPIGLQALRNQSNGTGKLAKLFQGIKPLGRGLALRLCLVYLLHV